jgi:uncharacterized membrane protein YdjX (TVP38/TMEM64 family)
MPAEPEPAPPAAPASRRGTRLRLALLAAILIGLFVAWRVSGLGAHFSSAELRALVERSGPWGIAIFAGLFVLGSLIYVPSLVFVAAAVLVWGRLRGGLYAYVAALIASSLSFAIIRLVGGSPLATVRNRRVRAVLARLERRPILVVAFLRALLLNAPAINYALALSPIGAGPYLLGTALGLVPSVAVTTSFFGILFT